MSPARAVAEEVARENAGISAAEILGKSRQAPIVRARRETMKRLYLSRNMATPALGEAFGMAPNNVRHHLLAAGVKLGRR